MRLEEKQHLLDVRLLDPAGTDTGELKQVAVAGLSAATLLLFQETEGVRFGVRAQIRRGGLADVGIEAWVDSSACCDAVRVHGTFPNAQVWADLFNTRLKARKEHHWPAPKPVAVSASAAEAFAWATARMEEGTKLFLPPSPSCIQLGSEMFMDPRTGGVTAATAFVVVRGGWLRGSPGTGKAVAIMRALVAPSVPVPRAHRTDKPLAQGVLVLAPAAVLARRMAQMVALLPEGSTVYNVLEPGTQRGKELAAAAAVFVSYEVLASRKYRSWAREVACGAEGTGAAFTSVSSMAPGVFQVLASLAARKLGDDGDGPGVLQCLRFRAVLFSDFHHVAASVSGPDGLRGISGDSRWFTSAGNMDDHCESRRGEDLLLPEDWPAGEQAASNALVCEHAGEAAAPPLEVQRDIVRVPVVDMFGWEDFDTEHEFAWFRHLAPTVNPGVVCLPGKACAERIVVEHERRLLRRLFASAEPRASVTIGLGEARFAAQFSGRGRTVVSFRPIPAGQSAELAEAPEGEEWREGNSENDSRRTDPGLWGGNDSEDDSRTTDVGWGGEYSEEEEEDVESGEEEEGPPPALGPSMALRLHAHQRKQVALVQRLDETFRTLGNQTCSVCATASCDTLTSCGHPFCFPCIRSATDPSAPCPVCMRKGRSLFFVPTERLLAPLPDVFDGEDAWVVRAWTERVCSASPARLTPCFLWIVALARACERRSRGLLVVVTSSTASSTLRRMWGTCLETGTVRALREYRPGHASRSAAQYAAGTCHLTVTKGDALSGARVTATDTVVLLARDLDVGDREFISGAVRTHSGGPLQLRRLVYSIEI